MRLLYLVVSGALVASAATAQSQLEPLSRLMQRPPDQVEVGYPFVRCAGLYSGAIRYGGANFGEELLTGFQDGYSRNLVVASLFRMSHAKENGYPVGDIETRAKQAMKEADRMADFYADRMEQNYASSGQAMGNDPLIMGDFEACKELGLVVEAVYESAGASR